MTEARKLFESQLKSPWPWKGSPHSTINEYDVARSAPEDSTARVFFDIGFRSWLGYFIAKQRTTGQSHYHGKAADQRIIANFEWLPVEERRQVATELVSVVPHESLPVDEEQLRSKRRRELATNNPSIV